MTLKQAWPGVSGKAQILDIRNDLAGVVVRQGVMPFADMSLPLMNKTSTMRPTVREFHAAIKRTSRADGAQLIYNDGPTGAFPTFSAAPGTGSRMDLLWVKAFDTLYDGTADVQFGITPGVSTTGTAVADRASMPEGALELGTLLIPAGATTLNSTGVVWTNTYQFGALRGMAIWVRDPAEFTAADAALHPAGLRGVVFGTQAPYEVRQNTAATPVRRWVRSGGGTFVGTRQQAIGNGAVSNLGAFNRDATYSDRDDFFTPGTSTLMEGDYLVSLTMGLTNVSGTGRNFVGINGGGTAARNGFGAGEDTVTVATALHIPEGGAAISTNAFLTVASSPNSPNFRIQITKVA
jgi:hypothetical protein